MTTKTDELKPCPFCGHVAPVLLGEHAPEWWVSCQGCNASTKARTTNKQAVEQWNTRAALQSQDREDAEVTAYALPGGISVERTMQRDGTCLWAVRDSFKNCLSKSGEWGYEPFPSLRTEEWLSAHRFNSASEAIGRARSIEGET